MSLIKIRGRTRSPPPPPRPPTLPPFATLLPHDLKNEKQGEKFPCMVRGGASVSVAPVSSSGGCTPSEGEGGGGEIFAVGFSGGAVALLDGRCGEQGGIVGGFVAMHRWLERIRCAGYLLMASYGRYEGRLMCFIS